MSTHIQYRLLKYDECSRIREINASQYIGRAWRKVEGVLQLVDINYNDPDYPEGYQNHLHRLQETLRSNGIVVGAFDGDQRLIGFSALDLSPFGEQYRYALLDQLFVSLEFRRSGIGKSLFLLTASHARERSIQKMYICAGSSEETIAFYRALGCVDAVEINTELADSDPRDLQLEFSV